MKNILKTFVSLAALALILGFIYKYREDISTRLVPALDRLAMEFGLKSAACEEPIPYVIGTFDTKFNISKSYFLDALAEAEMIWEKPFGKELFAYEVDNTKSNLLEVDLVYDYRQDATNQLQELGIVVKETRASYEALRAKFTALKAEFSVAKKNYDTRVKSFNTRQKAYEEQVEYWNAKGGAPKKEYDQLAAEKSALDREASELQSLQRRVNQMVDEINAMVVVLNRLAKSLNITVENYNTIGAERGESFTEGVYIEEGSRRQIEIYEFSNRTKLVRVLAHELGHALGLGHVEDPKAIMYELNQDNNQTLTESDLAALKTKCGVE